MPMVSDLLSHVILGAAYPVSISLMKTIYGKEIDMRLIHHVECKWLWLNVIQLVPVVPFPICNMDVGRDAST